MTIRTHIRLLLLLISCGLFAFSYSVVEAGFGISPSRIIEDKLVPGSSLTRTIYLVQGNPEEEVPIDITVDAEEIKEWISFSPDTSVQIPTGVQQFPLDITIAVPSDASTGIYTAFIRINTIPEQLSGDGQVAIALGGRVEVELTVGDDVFSEYSIKAIDIEDIAEGDPLAAAIRIVNSGNVPARPEAASFELFNKFGDIRLAYAQNESFENVPSFSEKTQELAFPVDVRLAVGEYWGHVKVYDTGGSVVGEQRTVFNVHEQTDTRSLAAATVLGSDTPWFMLGLVGIGGVALLVSLLLFRRRRNEKRM